jgi:protein O-GlcNAc transferase
VALRPKFFPALDGLGRAYFRQGQLSEAIAALVKATEQKQAAATYEVLGQAYLKAKQFQAAEQAFQTAIQLKPKLVQAHSGLGQVKLRQGELAAAVTAFTAVTELRRNHFAGYNSLSQIYFQQGQFRQAIEMLNRTLELKPNYAPAQKLLDEILTKQPG